MKDDENGNIVQSINVKWSKELEHILKITNENIFVGTLPVFQKLLCILRLMTFILQKSFYPI